MRPVRHRPTHLILAMAIAAGGVMVAPAAASSESESESSAGTGSAETTTTLTTDAPHASVDHNAGAGDWSFVVEGNRQVISVRVSVAENDCATGGATLWETKVTNDELSSGPVLRQAAFTEGVYCAHLLLDWRKNASATVTTTFPERRGSDPDPGPSESPSSETSPAPEVSPSDSPTPEVSATPAPSPEPTEIATSAEYDRCSDDADVDHRVLVGATGPDPDAPFIYTTYYPSTIQVHQGDVVEWCFNGGYDWHSVTFLPGDMDAIAHPAPRDEAHIGHHPYRWDETRSVAFNERWIHGADEGIEANQCGRGVWMGVIPALDHCKLSSTDQWVGSSIWDRFLGVTDPYTFRTQIDLGPGLYRYHCNLHPKMVGYVEVVPADQTTTNPSVADIEADIRGDYEAALARVDELSKDYDFEKREWTVHVGATTADHAVTIEQYIPARIEVSRGDTVRFVADAHEINSVTFPGDALKTASVQGSFNVGGSCKPHHCEGELLDLSGSNGATGRNYGKVEGIPYGMLGFAFGFGCEEDAPDGGRPLNMLAYMAPVAEKGTDGDLKHGCITRQGYPDPTKRTEMIFSPWLLPQAPHGDEEGEVDETEQDARAHPEQRAPRNLITTPKTFHNSGPLLDQTLPAWRRTIPAALGRPEEQVPGDFLAKFPAAGSFSFFCLAHEFMNGVVVVKP